MNIFQNSAKVIYIYIFNKILLIISLNLFINSLFYTIIIKLFKKLVIYLKKLFVKVFIIIVYK